MDSINPFMPSPRVPLSILGNRPGVSLIITTFNWPSALEKVLKSVEEQTIQPAQVLIADDGSITDNRSVVEVYQSRLPITIVWQKDCNFRAARVRNLSLSRVQCDYVIFVDGDCLLPKTFIQQHIKLAQKRKIVAGSRFLIDEQETRKVLEPERQNCHGYAFSSYKFTRLPLGILRDIRPRAWQSVRSCNFSACTDDILNVGGFDESYIGWGREDSDLIARMLRVGMTIRNGRFAACVAHLDHEEQSRARLSLNDNAFKQTLEGNEITQASQSILGEL